MSSQYHRKDLLKVLNEAYLPIGTSIKKLVIMIRNIVGSHCMSFNEDKLTFEGIKHNKTLYITINYHDHVINRVLIFHGSNLNIFPRFTLTQLSHNLGKIYQSHVNMRAFDGEQRDTKGDIDLYILIGTTEFKTKFYFLDINSSYNLLLEAHGFLVQEKFFHPFISC